MPGADRCRRCCRAKAFNGAWEASSAKENGRCRRHAPMPGGMRGGTGRRWRGNPRYAAELAAAAVRERRSVMRSRAALRMRRQSAR
eukprot:359211-Chlamydomonas_euryale.AAC.2